MSFPVHHVELHQKEDQSGPDSCCPECPVPIHHKVLQQRKDQLGPVKFRFESPPPSITRNCNRAKTVQTGAVQKVQQERSRPYNFRNRQQNMEKNKGVLEPLENQPSRGSESLEVHCGERASRICVL
ncbi:hypothetical protein TNCV_4009191 [Trichonephila clavipes]|nr:hypothetical protein TNCV_4009191 [Trichonephila clavipes]